MENPNSLSYLELKWVWWDRDKRDIRVRKMLNNDFVINESNNKLSFYKKNMPFEEFIKHFGTWYGDVEKMACLLGENIRKFEQIQRDFLR